MLFYRNLDQIIFNRNQLLTCDELIIISGYVGPTPIRQLQSLPIKSTVVYGMYGCDGIQRSLHSALLNAKNELSKVNILYSTVPVHAKCYIWKYKGEVRSALVGSANFSTNGITTPFKEILADATADTFDPLDQYINMVLTKSIPCDDAIVSENKRRRHVANEDTFNPVYVKDVCSMPLFIIENGQPVVPAQSGINWGLAKLSGSHVNINDAYIRIGTDLLEHYPEMFPKKQECPSDGEQIGRVGHRHNDNVEILWDDGTTMTALLEGSVSKEFNGQRDLYPKQISSSPSKAELGKYLRKRMGIPEGHRITYADLQKYGRTTIDVSMQGDGIYYFDFSTVGQPRNTVSTFPHRYTEHYPPRTYPPKNTAVNEPGKKLNVGDKVRHHTFGLGTVCSIDNNIIEVQFDCGIKRFQNNISTRKYFL